MNNVVPLQAVEKKALGLYVLAGTPGYAGDFLEALCECDNIPVLEFLLELLVTPNENQSQDNKERNALAAPLVEGRLKRLKEDRL